MKNQLAADIQKLANGSAAVADRASTLGGATPILTQPIGPAYAGTGELAARLASLADRQEGPLDGANQLATGTTPAQYGAGNLKSGSTKLPP